MGSHKGNIVHQVMGDHPAETLEDFLNELTDQEFVVVEEWYKDNVTGESAYKGPIGLNARMVGKVKVAAF